MKMSKKLKIYAMLIFTLALVIILGSCGDSGNGESDGGNDTAEENGGNINAAVSDEPVNPRDIPDGLPEADYGGAKFRILHRNTCVRSNWALYDVHHIEITTEEENGDVINDALYRRNKIV